MCGLGVIMQQDGSIAQRDPVDRMLASMPTRGPNAMDVHTAGPFVLGHRRLSIIDPDPRSHQPMTDHLGRTVVFNGEIYNHSDLRRDLADRWSFKTLSDTEVILAAYERWGDACFARFNGDWAVAIHDPHRGGSHGALVVSRDRFGVKPLYHAEHEGVVLLASTVLAITRAGHPGSVRARTVREMIERGKTEPGLETHVDGVHAIEPGTITIFAPGATPEVSRYWTDDDLFGSDVPRDFEDAVSVFGEILEDAVRLRLRADVPVGVCLSGGLDSSLIVALAARNLDHPVRTFSGVAPGYGSDESQYANLVAFHAGAHTTSIELTLDRLMGKLNAAVQALESPIGGFSSIARMLVLERAAQDVTVLLDGQGGDELLAGYRRMHKRYRAMHPDRTLDIEPGPRARPSRFSKGAELAEPHTSWPERAWELPSPSRKLDRVTLAQYEALRGPGLLSLLHTEDRLTMAFSTEGRVPFLDHRLVSLCFSTPIEFRIQGEDKRLARAMGRRSDLIPRAIPDRRDKSGFATPAADMLRTSAGAEAMRNVIEHHANEQILSSDVLHALIDEHESRDAENADRIIRAVSVLLYFEQTGYAIGPN